MCAQASLWGNQYDLSISAGEQRPHEQHVDADEKARMQRIACKRDAQREHILIDHSQPVIAKMLANSECHCAYGRAFSVCTEEQQRDIHFVLDNAGMELFSDLCLADCLLHNKLCAKVVFHAKVSQKIC
jgi:hypothetical protein